ncbi:MAG: 50S ribosomal protein L13 [Chloroflexi bacterium]|nr:50S ribosomal protein L13 [Chloroflexota bacterium]
MNTYFAKASDIERRWWVIDVSGKTLGRVATEIATLLRGKGKPIYSPHADVGDYVVVVNAAKVHVTGKKAKQKVYYRHSNYPGGLKAITLERMLQNHPTRVIQHAVKGMLSHNRQGRAMLRRLKVYAGDTHPHQAQVEAQRRG